MIDMSFDDKQIMLISDGMTYSLESDTPADVVTKLKDHGITTSVIHPAAREEGIATLQSIAEAGGGSYFEIIREDDLLEIMFSEIADDLTQSVVEGRTPVHIKREQDSVLKGLASVPDVLGYTYAKAKASATTVLTVDYVKSSGNVVEAPLYVYWNYGNGKVSTFTSTFTGDWSAEWQAEGGTRFFENVYSANTPAARVDYPYNFSVDYDGTYSRVEIIPVVLNPYATVDVTVTLPDDTTVTERLTFDSTRYFYAFETPLRGRYLVNITYAYADKKFEAETAFHLGYSPEYDAFAVYDPAALHAAIRNRGTVSEGSIPSLENDEKEVATYVMRFAAPLMIAAAIMYVLDVIIRKLRLSDIKSFFGVKKKGGSK